MTAQSDHRGFGGAGPGASCGGGNGNSVGQGGSGATYGGVGGAVRVADLDEAGRIASESPYATFGGAIEVRMTSAFPRSAK